MQIFDFFECSGQNSSNPQVNFKLTSHFVFKFCIILHFHDTNSPVKTPLPNMLWWKCAKFLMFWKHKSFFLQIFHQYSVPSKVTPLYLFSSNIFYFGQQQSIKAQHFKIFECSGQNLSNSSWQFELTSQFHFNFCIILHCHDT